MIINESSNVLVLLLRYLLFIVNSFCIIAFPSPLWHPRIETHHKAWQNSGKFQGDIDGIEPISNVLNAAISYNALKDKEMIWPDGIIPYEMDAAFSEREVKLIEKAFNYYKKYTCINFQSRNEEDDYLYITKGLGCYSQIGRTGGKQQVSLGRGCLFHEIVLHELMHSIGFWHEHSRADRDEHIRILWENILPGMQSQFDKISAALQDLLGEQYDYKSIMHYDSTAFSKNGMNTIEATEKNFTTILGSALELSKVDIKKINKLYKCHPMNPSTNLTSTDSPPRHTINNCEDHFNDCPSFSEYCDISSFVFVMKTYCPETCGHCANE